MKDSVPYGDIDQPLTTVTNSESKSLSSATAGALPITPSINERIKEWRNRHSFLSLILEVIILVVFVVIPFRTIVAQPFQVYGDSMNPNFADNDYLIVNQLDTHFGDGPERYEVIVFIYPGNNRDYYIKRVVGLPGDRVTLEDGVTTIYNEINNEGLVINDDYVTGDTFGSVDVTLGDEEYFVLGDNRENSSDSRIWGPLPKENIVGNPIIRLFPLNELDLQPGKIEP